MPGSGACSDHQLQCFRDDRDRDVVRLYEDFAVGVDPERNFGPDADGRAMPQWDPYTAEDPCRMYFGRKIFADREKPSELMQFLLRHEMKKRGY